MSNARVYSEVASSLNFAREELVREFEFSGSRGISQCDQFVVENFAKPFILYPERNKLAG